MAARWHSTGRRPVRYATSVESVFRADGPGTPAFEANEPGVVFEGTDSRVPVIHLEGVSYYALDESASDIWRAMVKVTDPSALADACGGSAADVQRRFEDLLGSLLIRPVAGAPLTPADGSRSESASSPGCERFIDPQDLLVLDPIRDVDLPAGWPSSPANRTSR